MEPNTEVAVEVQESLAAAVEKVATSEDPATEV
jgi:hypothetical protein